MLLVGEVQLKLSKSVSLSAEGRPGTGTKESDAQEHSWTGKGCRTRRRGRIIVGTNEIDSHIVQAYNLCLPAREVNPQVGAWRPRGALT